MEKCEFTLATGELIRSEVTQEQEQDVIVIYYRTKETTEYVTFNSKADFREYLKMLMRFDVQLM